MNSFKIKTFGKIGAVLGLFFFCFFVSACHEKEDKRIQNLELTVVAEEKLPQTLLETIDPQKEQPFKFTYEEAGYVYICIGYGRQESGGYSIQVEDLYLTENSIHVKTSLMGPSAAVKEAQKEPTASCPYIVIKTEALDYPVVFE